MKKALVILTALCAVAGCDQVINKADINEVCISGVVYLVYKGYSKAGITPKVNADFYPYTCNNNDVPN
ncbi:hypothetical protein [Rodentibacter abscessus]|uniref:hypothetical protein n=1 Tax=Rodentibacter abscessus TaxID=3381777 RepID=UPI00399CA832